MGLVGLLSVMGFLGPIGCGDLSKLAGTPPLPSDFQDPAVYQNATGAIGAYRGALAEFAGYSGTDPHYVGAAPGAFALGALAGGVLTDELATLSSVCAHDGVPTGVCTPSYRYPTGQSDVDDQRMLPMATTLGGTDAGYNGPFAYTALQRTRAAATLALGLLGQYAPDSVDLQAELHVVQGYAELLLADLYCSGVPLSTLDYHGDYTYQPGSTTAEVYRHALAQFDTALTLVRDSVRVQHWARVGQGRARLALGDYAGAAQAVRAVPDTFVVAVVHNWTYGSLGRLNGWGINPANGEGQTGLRYFEDPRSAVREISSWSDVPNYFPLKYGGALGVGPIPVASGSEARLIEAEADLRTGGTQWLAILNQLRATATVPGMTDPLPALTDPGSDTARVSLLFAERGEWLYLTAHRQGDLRRLIRQYGRPQDQVYPTGPYPLTDRGLYGRDVTYPIPSAEYRNPKFTSPGCLDRSA